MSKIRIALAKALGSSWQAIESSSATDALVRYQYKSFNALQKSTSIDFIENYNRVNPEYFLKRGDKFDLTNKYHEDVARTVIFSREKVKYDMQKLYGTLEPEKQTKIDQRQIEMYGKKTEDPATDPGFESFVDKQLKKPDGKNFIIEEIVEKAFTSGGKNIVEDSINSFADKAVIVQIEVDATREDVIRESVDGDFVEKPVMGVDKCIYEGTDLDNLSEEKLVDVYADKISNDVVHSN